VITIATVVEGHGEVRALPILVRRVAHEHGYYDVETPEPFRLPRGRFLTPAEFERVIEIQARSVVGSGGVVALLDADNDCAVELAKKIREGYLGNRRYALVAAVREYESIFLAGKVVGDPEEVRDAKRAVTRLTGKYRETVHQASLSAMVDLDHARRCRWFRKFEREQLTILGG
jgi:hypothetical protein